MKILAAFVILLQVSQQASAVTLEVKEGDLSVLLPCKAPAGVTLPLTVDTVVEWKRLNPDITVHVRRDNRDQPNDQSQQYRSRTSLSQDALKSGDLSLTLKNIQLVDQAVYDCSASKGRDTLFSNKVDLQVISEDEAELAAKRDEFHNLYITFLVLFILTLIVALVLAGVVYKEKHMKGRSAVDM
ncbi:erythroid membrane-associated protein-like [Scomber japonicus]|uniref:erythroid membrane-associated protein-like n=1 Tax=Scomber japonicus TaxID=13676 RepID=UPI002306C108|nr:erythroid membrane-associated protein-like [Scomber japonicus]